MKLQLEKTPCFIVSKPESEKERRCIRYMKTFESQNNRRRTKPFLHLVGHQVDG